MHHRQQHSEYPPGRQEHLLGEVIHADLMKPITPTALGGIYYVSKFNDEKTKGNETLHHKSNAEAAESLRRFVQDAGALLRYRTQHCCAHRGNKNTGEKVRR